MNGVSSCITSNNAQKVIRHCFAAAAESTRKVKDSTAPRNSRVSSAPLSTHRSGGCTHRSFPACVRSRIPAGRTSRTRKNQNGGRGRTGPCRNLPEERRGARTPTAGGSAAPRHPRRRGRRHRDETCCAGPGQVRGDTNDTNDQKAYLVAT